MRQQIRSVRVITWQTIVPLPPQILSPNEIVGSIGARHARALAEDKYKALCTDIFDTCPVRGARFVRVSMLWYIVRDAEQKAKPRKPGGKISKAAIKRQPGYIRDVGNAWGAFKYGIDAMIDQYKIEWEDYVDEAGKKRKRQVSKTLIKVGIVPKDDYHYMAGGACDIWDTATCRKNGIFKPGIKVTLEIEEEGKLDL